MTHQVAVNFRQGSMQHYPVVLKRDIRYLLELRTLLGEHKTASLKEDEHPLAAGLRLARKWLLQQPLTAHEGLALQQTALFAKTFCEVRRTWEGHRKKMAKDLLNPGQCQARMFELHVIRYALGGKVGRIQWLPWAAGKDIVTSDPHLEIECKLILSSDLERLFKKTSEARKKHPAGDVPFVIAVGFKDEFPADPAHALSDLCIKHAEELIAPDVSATLFFVPLEAGGRSQFLGIPILWVQYGACWEIPNPLAVNPLPEGFGFGSRAQSLVERTDNGEDNS